MNGCETTTAKIPRKDLEVLTKDEALAIAVQQQEIQDKLASWRIVDSDLTVYKGLEAILNIFTERQPQDVQAVQS